MRRTIENLIKRKKVLLLGFGREGRSTLRLIKKWFPDQIVGIADRDENIPVEFLKDFSGVQLFTGDRYLDSLQWADVVIKSPGIRSDILQGLIPPDRITSQTDLFLEHYHHQIIGITGTKGKSTTTSLIYHCLQQAGISSVMAGNIGIPPFDVIEYIQPDTLIVFELSAHQLESVRNSPHIAIMTNLFPEHLDHFQTFENYASAKMNIGRFQRPDDCLIWDAENPNLVNFIDRLNHAGFKIPVSISRSCADETFRKFFLSDGKIIDLSNTTLQGLHNLKNVLLAAHALEILGLSPGQIENGIATFQPLSHRLELIGEARGIRFINDSISTIPEATIEAIKTFPDTHTLILGGFDRGLDYRHLVEFLLQSRVENLIFTGKAGKRMMSLFENYPGHQKRLFFAPHFYDIGMLILKNTPCGTTCLLSPAASSYDQFDNFEERGKAFIEIMKQLRKL